MGITWYIADAFLMRSVVLMAEPCPCPFQGEPHMAPSAVMPKGYPLVPLYSACLPDSHKVAPFALQQPRGVFLNVVTDPSHPDPLRVLINISDAWGLMQTVCTRFSGVGSHSAFLTSSIDSRTQ